MNFKSSAKFVYKDWCLMRVAKVKFKDGSVEIIPRANLEVILSN